jgi:hypothetical protein
VDKKILYMGLAALALVILMLLCGGFTGCSIGGVWKSHTNQVEEGSP